MWKRFSEGPSRFTFHTLRPSPLFAQDHFGVFALFHLEDHPVVVAPPADDVVGTGPQGIALARVVIETFAVGAVADEATLVGSRRAVGVLIGKRDVAHRHGDVDLLRVLLRDDDAFLDIRRQPVGEVNIVGTRQDAAVAVVHVDAVLFLAVLPQFIILPEMDFRLGRHHLDLHMDRVDQPEDDLFEIAGGQRLGHREFVFGVRRGAKFVRARLDVDRVDPAESERLPVVLIGVDERTALLLVGVGKRGVDRRRRLDLDLDGCSDLAALPVDVALFSESPGRFLITTAPADAERFEQQFDRGSCRRAGRVTADGRLRVQIAGNVRFDLGLDPLKVAFKETLADE